MILTADKVRYEMLTFLWRIPYIHGTAQLKLDTQIAIVKFDVSLSVSQFLISSSLVMILLSNIIFLSIFAEHNVYICVRT